MPEYEEQNEEDWGKLPPKLAKDLMEAKRENVSENYRSQVQAYFQAMSESENHKKMTRTFTFHNFLSKFLPVVSVFIFCEAILGQPPATKDSVEWKNPFKPDEVDKAIESGIEFLLSNQKDNGAIYDRGNPTSITALSLMSLAAVGHLLFIPMKKGKQWPRLSIIFYWIKIRMKLAILVKMVVACTDMALLHFTLAEMLGMGMDEETDKAIREKCQIAIDLIDLKKFQKIKPSREGGDIVRTLRMPIYP